MMQNSTSRPVNFAAVHVAVSSPKPQLEQACHCTIVGNVDHLNPYSFPSNLDHTHPHSVLVLRIHATAQLWAMSIT